MTSWLITGASGYVASAIASHLAGQASLIRRLSRSPMMPLAISGTTIEDMRADYNDTNALQAAVSGMDVVAHLASETSVYAAERDPEESRKSIVGITQQLLEASDQCGTAPFFLFAGTATQCGLTEDLPVDESHHDAPITTYDRHKLEAEGAVKQFGGCSLRLSNVYGPGPASSAEDRSILNRLIGKALSGEAITIYGDGSPVRDYTYIDDVARAFVSAASHREATAGSHYLIGTGTGHSLAEAFALVADRVSTLVGIKPEIQNTPWPEDASPIEFRNFIANSAAFRKATGWHSEIALGDGIDRTIAAIQAGQNQAGATAP